MEVLRSKRELADWIRSCGNSERTLVPTMGALHRGHTSLIALAREKTPDNDVVATIFVNPTQFGPNEDFDSYPRQLEDDLHLCEEHGAAAVFAPSANEMYQADTSILIHESALSHRLCGASRPGHFDGVCTIVAKLFLMTQPSAAIFGEKDFQQLVVLRRLVRDLDFPIDIIPGPTVREGDGLAMSSRNAYLSAEERAQAPVIFRSLTRVAKGISEGIIKTPDAAIASLTEEIGDTPLARIDYLEIVDSSSLEAITSLENTNPRLLAAVFFGKTRLIDNVGPPALIDRGLEFARNKRHSRFTHGTGKGNL